MKVETWTLYRHGVLVSAISVPQDPQYDVVRKDLREAGYVTLDRHAD